MRELLLSLRTWEVKFYRILSLPVDKKEVLAVPGKSLV
jgi:hypothetical protein